MRFFGTPARFSLSPDGGRLAFVAVDRTGTRRLYVKSLNGSSATALPGTEGALNPFWSPTDQPWSPDQVHIAFVTDGTLQRFHAVGGSSRRRPVFMSEIPGTAENATTGTWSHDGVILMSSSAFQGQEIIHRIPASGGTLVPVTTLNAREQELWHRYPCFLPDGRHFTYTAGRRGGGARTYVASLDSNDRKLLVEGGSNAKYAQGRLLFMRGEALIAKSFDIKRLAVSDNETRVVEHIATGGFDGMQGAFSVSEAGVLVYQAESDVSSINVLRN